MKMAQFLSFLKIGVVIGFVTGTSGAGEGELPKDRLTGWSFGEAIFGDEVNMQELRGKVVAIEYWGTGCGACLESMPQLVEMDRKYRNKGLRVIAGEMRESPKERIGEVVDRFDIDFTVTKGMSGPVSVGGFPHALVFDAEGRIVFKGRPASEDFEKAIREAVKDVKVVKPAPVVANPKPASKDLIPTRTWTNKEGKKIEASVTEISGDKLIFRLGTGKTHIYEIKNLSEEDQLLIQKKQGQ